MRKISVLGPKGTFTELAAKKYIELTKNDGQIVFYPTITKVFNSIGKDCEYGIIPIENTLDGYVQLSLDLLTHTELQINNELVIPIQFAFVGNVADISEIKKIYAQFKTQGQCCKFIEQLSDVKIITTDSNGESYECLKNAEKGTGAIIPQYILNTENTFPLKINNVTDSEKNETRFLVLSRHSEDFGREKKYKTSIVVYDVTNQPGSLTKVLNEFSEKGINMSSIMSRPTKEALGKYLFFIDIDGHYPMEEKVREAISRISERTIVKILGSYTKI